MKKTASSSSINGFFSFFFIFIIPLLFSVQGSLGQTTTAGADFNYNPSSSNGPNNWGTLRPEWSQCGSGTRQSPIDLDLKVDLVLNAPRLVVVSRPANATITNTGRGIELRWTGDAGFIEMNGIQHPLVRAIWRTPAEHTILRLRAPLEVQLVFGRNATVIVSALHLIGLAYPLLSLLTTDMEVSLNTRNVTRVVGIINPRQVIDIENTESHYRYTGSLSAPPCTEPVVWIVLKRLRTATRQQVELLRSSLDDTSVGNARPIQPRNNRLVSFFVPTRN